MLEGLQWVGRGQMLPPKADDHLNPHSNLDLLHLVEGHLFAAAVVEVGRLGAGVVRRGCGLFETAAVF